MLLVREKGCGGHRSLDFPVWQLPDGISPISCSLDWEVLPLWVGISASFEGMASTHTPPQEISK